MAENSAIEWTHHTWNPWLGCTKLAHPDGSACDFCYAATWAKRTGQSELWEGERRRTTADYWKKPTTWNRIAIGRGERYRIFPSLCDPFDNQVPEEWRAEFWERIRSTPALDWLLLTKRPQNIPKMLPESWGPQGWHNVWLGVTAEDQERYRERYGHLQKVPAHLHFISYEPALGALTELPLNGHTPDWLIAGGESGGKARPANPNWFRRVRDDCERLGIAFLFKQHGEWREPLEHEDYDTSKGRMGNPPAFIISDDGTVHCFSHLGDDNRPVVVRVGKKAAGRLLDGVEHSGFPGVRYAI